MLFCNLVTEITRIESWFKDEYKYTSIDCEWIDTIERENFIIPSPYKFFTDVLL